MTRHVLLRWSQLADRFSTSSVLLLVISGAFGALWGMATATWQHPVGTAQVLMGLVTYEPASLSYAYHASVFSLLNYISWLFLALTHSEVASSVLLCALLGMVAVQTVAMIAFLVVRNALLATLIALLAGAMHLIGAGISYPIFFMGGPHAFGRGGLSAALFAVLCLALSWERTGFFLCGLTLFVHPSWGVWINGCLLVVIAVRHRQLSPLVRRETGLWYVAGVGISVVVYAWHRRHFPVANDGASVDMAAARHLFLNYITYWDYHRQKIAETRVLVAGLANAGVALGWAIFKLRTGVERAGERLFYYIVVVASISSVFFVFVPSWFDPTRFPETLIVLIPGRFINFSIWLALPVLLSLLIGARPTLLRLTAAACMWIGISLAANYAKHRAGFAPSVTDMGLWRVALLVALTVTLKFPKPRESASILLLPRNLVLGAVCVALLLAATGLAARRPWLRGDQFGRTVVPAGGGVTVLTTMDDDQLQEQSRHPTLTPMLDGYVYASPASLVQLNHYTQDVFGISLAADPPRANELHSGELDAADYAGVWGSRSCEEWARLASTWSFELILVRSTLPLRLPIVATNSRSIWYRPACA